MSKVDKINFWADFIRFLTSGGVKIEFRTSKIQFFHVRIAKIDSRAQKLTPGPLKKGSGPPKNEGVWGCFWPPLWGGLKYGVGDPSWTPKKGSGPPPKPGLGPPQPCDRVWGGPNNHITPRIDPRLGVQNRGLARARPENLVGIWRTGSEKWPPKTPPTGGFYVLFRKNTSRIGKGHPISLVQQASRALFFNSGGVWKSRVPRFLGGPNRFRTRFWGPGGSKSGVPGGQKRPSGGVPKGPNGSQGSDPPKEGGLNPSKPVSNPSKVGDFSKSRLIFGTFWVSIHKSRRWDHDFKDFSSKSVILSLIEWIFNQKVSKFGFDTPKLTIGPEKLIWSA